MPPMSNTTDFIVHDKQDNVGVVVVEKTPENQECTGWVMEDDSTIKIKANTSIPLGHKIALQDFKTGDTKIGRASCRERV